MTDTHHRHASFFRRRERERERKRKSIRSLPFPPSTEFGKFYQPFGYIAGSNLEKGPRVGEIGRDKCAFTRNCSRYCRGTLGIPIGRAMPGNSCHLLLFLRRSSACD